jgi:hypothetical protein
MIPHRILDFPRRAGPYALGAAMGVALTAAVAIVWVTQLNRVQTAPPGFWQQSVPVRPGTTREQVHRLIRLYDRSDPSPMEDTCPVYGYKSWLVPYRCRFDIKVYHTDGRVIDILRSIR